MTRVEQAVTTEATLLTQANHQLLHFDLPEKTLAAREALIRYTQSIIDDEWISMRNGQASQKTNALQKEFFNQISNLRAQTHLQEAIFVNLLRSVDSLRTLHNERLRSATAGLPASFWKVIASLLLLVMIMGGFFAGNASRLAVFAAQLTALGFIIGFLFSLDYPFYGETSIPSEPFKRVLVELQKTTAN